MSQENVDALLDRWINDEEFRSSARTDLDAAIKSTGLELNDEEWEALRAIDLSTVTNQQLEERISKGRGGFC